MRKLEEYVFYKCWDTFIRHDVYTSCEYHKICKIRHLKWIDWMSFAFFYKFYMYLFI